ncbi:MAG TPA: xanthine dehydrogenase family protein molybdopterin-binding subunit [Chloroflexota bacterium]|jgi:carbon-monoxide dehydrogenase large subunit
MAVVTPANFADIRVDGVDKVTGEAIYAADISRPGMLHAKALRSPFPHARIVSIDVSRARAVPGVRAVLTAQDLPDVRVGRSMRDVPVLAREKVRFVGEKVAAVAADDLETAEGALALIDAQYEELPAVFDPVEATLPTAPVIHEPDFVRSHATATQKVAEYPNSVSNPIWGVSQEEVERGLASSDYVFEHTFHTPIQHQAYIEPHCCLVELDERGIAHIWASNKAPFLLLNYLRLGLGLQRDQVEIHMLALGGDFGGKGSFMDIPLAYYLAKATGRPVKMGMTYTEELMASNPRHSATIIVRSGFDRTGRLMARYTRSYYNSGAYAGFKPSPDATLPRIKTGGLGPYGVPVWRVEGHMVYTNTVPCGHMRAPGGAQAVHATEAHMDLCAREMGIDPLEIRLKNTVDEVRHTGTAPKGKEVLRRAALAVNWGQPKPDGVGRGIALVEIHNSPADGYTARMIVQRGGEVVLETPIIENGAGMLTTFRLLTAEQLGVAPDSVRITQTMEDFVYDRGVGGSRLTRVVGKMIGLLGERMRMRLREVVAEEEGCPLAGVIWDTGRITTPEGRAFTLHEVSELAGADLVEAIDYPVDESDTVEIYGAIGAEVEIDRVTGELTVRHAAMALETGRIVNPIMFQGQIDGGLTQGIGYALMEGIELEDGHVTQLNLHEYKLPTIADIPPLATELLPPDLSLGLTPIGEGPNCAMAPAIANAVLDIVGRQIDIPITAESILEALEH